MPADPTESAVRRRAFPTGCSGRSARGRAVEARSAGNGYIIRCARRRPPTGGADLRGNDTERTVRRDRAERELL